MYSVRFALLTLALIVPGLCKADPPALQFPSFPELQRDAVESVNITLGPLALWLAKWVIKSDDPGSPAARQMPRGVRKIHIRSYRFETDHFYSQSDLQALRSRLEAPGWHQMIQVRDQAKSENVDMYYALDKHKVTALVVLAMEPREFTLVDMTGTIDLNQVATLGRTFASGAQNPTHLPKTTR